MCKRFQLKLKSVRFFHKHCAEKPGVVKDQNLGLISLAVILNSILGVVFDDRPFF